MQMFSAQGILPDMEEERINDVFDRYGPTPRLCINYLCNPKLLNKYKDELQDAISDLTIEKLERLFKDSRKLAMDSNSHKICLVSRKGRPSSKAVVATITPTIQSRIAIQFRNVERAEQIRLYECFVTLPYSRALAGLVFEAAGQRQLQEGIKLDIVPMVQLKESRKNSLPQWYSSHLLIYTESLEQSRQLALQQLSIDIPQPQVIVYGDGPLSINPNVLYIPELTNQVAFDSFILSSDDFLYIFQFTVKTHDIKSGIIATLAKCSGIPDMVRWRFVFLMEPNQRLICPQPQSLILRQLRLFSAVISL
jgi:hypothetical protein